MTEKYDEHEGRLSAGLHQRVSGLHEAPFSVDDVKGRATVIKRNRRLAVAGGILGAAAVIVPIAVVLGPGSADPSPVPPANSPSATGDPTTEPTGASDPATPAPPPSGLALPYLEGTTLTSPDGSTRELPERYHGFGIIGEDVYALRNTDEGSVLDVIDADGTLTETIETTGPVATNTERAVLAYVTPTGTLVLVTPSDRTEVADVGTGAIPAVVAGDPTCSDGCLVYLDGGGADPEPLVAYPDGSVEPVGDGIKVNSVDDAGHVAVQLSYSDTGSCSAVLDESSDEPVFETCEFSFDDFAPGGAHLSATDDYRDGIGAGYVAILDAVDGSEVTRYDAEDGFIRDYVWEDAEHLLVQQYDAQGWRIVRVGVDGSVETAIGPSSEGDDLTPAYTLPAS